MPYYVYIIRCDDNSFYTGYSGNLARRLSLHVKGKGARYLRIHKPTKLVYVEEFSSRTEAMRKERKVKLLNHGQKLSLSKSKHNILRGIKGGRSARSKVKKLALTSRALGK